MSQRTLPALVLVSLVLGGCAGDAVETEDDVWVDDTVRPTNLALDIVIVGADELNPNGDGSGVVQFQATADDAVRYTYVVGNRAPQESADGAFELADTNQGTERYAITVSAFSADGVAASLSEEVTVYRSDARFPRLVWSDEFDEDGPFDSEKWHPQVIPPIDGGWFNGEQQHYTGRAENAYVSDGTLKIVALREDYTVQGSTRPYTSARLNSTFIFTYGRVEVRAKLPEQGGTWPAIWTLGANINEIGNPFGDEYGSVGWPACGEIDIMEQRGWDKNTTLAYFHWGNTRTNGYETEGSDIANPASTDAFHDYVLEWSDTSMDIYVDDRLVHSLANTEERPYDNPHYLLLNIAMGGALGGEIPGNFREAVMEIDYVRVYQ